MKSPFTFKRYIATALVLSVVAILLMLIFEHGDAPVWLNLLLALLIGCCIPASLWFVGDIAWRGTRSSRLAPVRARSIVIRIGAGIGLIVLSHHAPEIMWEIDIDLPSSLIGLIGSIMTIFAVGQVIGLGMKRKDETEQNPSPLPRDPAGHSDGEG